MAAKRIFTDAREKRIARLYLEGAGTEILANKFNCGITAIRKALARQGVELRQAGRSSTSGKLLNCSPEARRQAELSAAQAKAAASLWSLGKSESVIAKRLGISVGRTIALLARTISDDRLKTAFLLAVKAGVQYDDIWTARNTFKIYGTCCICQAEHRLVIDHDHATGKTRGMICGRCNSGLGHFKDNIDSLRQAVAYLKAQR